MLARAFNDNYSTVVTVNNETFLLGCIASRDDERAVFREVEEVLRYFTIDPELIGSAIEPVRQYILKEQRPNCADFLNYLEVVEKTPAEFDMAKLFSYVPVPEKYLLIDSIFASLVLKDGKLDFTLRPSFSLLLKNSIEKLNDFQEED